MSRDPRPRAIGTGLLALDIVMSADSETPVRAFAGGTCGNVLAILAYLGWEAFPVARLSDDVAALRLRRDLERWGVRLDFAFCGPPADTPIIIQEIRHGRDGLPSHRFAWVCPRCGRSLPRFKAVTTAAIEAAASGLPGSAVFLMDRLSRASLTLAAEAARQGATVVFEPSAKGNPRLVVEALQVAHIIKYASSRLEGLDGAMSDSSATIVEIQTVGADGLRYRERLQGTVSPWRTLPVVPAPRMADSCGSGDWCTAGIISRLLAGGKECLLKADRASLEEALRYGQTLAAWNCGFEGARGGMYACNRSQFEAQIDAIRQGAAKLPTRVCTTEEALEEPSCPACTSVGDQAARAALAL